MTEHPIFPAGYNADDNNGDEVDGAGTNWAVWPVLFDSFIAIDIFILTPDMLAVFDGCPDVEIAAMDTTTLVEAEYLVFVAGSGWPGWEPYIPERGVTVGRLWPDYVVPAEDTTLVVPTKLSTADVWRST